MYSVRNRICTPCSCDVELDDVADRDDPDDLPLVGEHGKVSDPLLGHDGHALVDRGIGPDVDELRRRDLAHGSRPLVATLERHAAEVVPLGDDARPAARPRRREASRRCPRPWWRSRRRRSQSRRSRGRPGPCRRGCRKRGPCALRRCNACTDWIIPAGAPAETTRSPTAPIGGDPGGPRSAHPDRSRLRR